MNLLNRKIELYLGRKPDFIDEVQVLDDGKGNLTIDVWNATDKDKPTEEQLNAFTDEATKLQNNEKIRIARKEAYGDIGDQLDLLYKDMLAGKGDSTGEWFKSIKAVKDANPKEE